VILNGALPSFELDWGGVLLALVRGCSVAGLLSVFGTLTFRSVVETRCFSRLLADEAAALDRRVVRWAWANLGFAAVALLVWLPMESGSMSGAATLAATAGAMPTVLRGTSFGHFLTAQLAGLIATGLAMRFLPRRAWVATVLSGVTLALQSGHSHSASMYSGLSFLLASELLHLLAAGAWVGGLWPLLLVVRHGTPKAGALACRWFSPLGKWCVVVLLATASVQFWELIGGVPGLVGTAYGWVALVKIALYGALFGFALLNRYTLAPRLMGPAPEPTRRALVRSIAVQTMFGLAAVLAAGLLSQLNPSIHAEPVWPFTVEPSLVTVREDAEFRDEVVRALLALMGAAAIIGVGIIWRRRRVFALSAVGVAAVLTAKAVPHLDLLFVPATATTYYRSPTSFATNSILAGAALYPKNCASCHGTEGHGDGPAAKGLPVPPADLTAPHLWDHADGELFGWIAHGMEAPEGGLAMPGFSPGLSDDDIWALIDFIRAHNAGSTYAATGAWSPPVQAPSFQVTCAGHDPADLANWRGSVVRLVFGGTPPQPQHGVATVRVGAEDSDAGAGGCRADDEALRNAYSVVTGLNPAELEGAEVIIDANGWLREVRRRVTGSDAAALLAIVDQPLPPAAGAGGQHHH
jgi:putative copper export protein/mono/diheme cytochrome c family protein